MEGKTSAQGAVLSPLPIPGGMRIQHEVRFFLYQTGHHSSLKRLLESKKSWEPEVLGDRVSFVQCNIISVKNIRIASLLPSPFSLLFHTPYLVLTHHLSTSSCHHQMVSMLKLSVSKCVIYIKSQNKAYERS